MRNIEQDTLIKRSLKSLHSIVSSDIKPIFIILVDISGYTRFIRFHKISLLHAEKIIGELMESILEQVEVPVMAHEILGDAISLYAIDEGMPGHADKIYAQLQKYFNAFRDREASLISQCSLCECDACKQVGKLKLKAILHYGEAAFTKVHTIQKISGEDVILSHRLLKNGVPSHEYILMTTDFAEKCLLLDKSGLLRHREYYEDIGDFSLLINNFDEIRITATKMTFLEKVRGMLILEKYMITRFFKKSPFEFRNLPYRK